ncbi:hypothetical protein FHR22_003231 [Sphingopyxis panaciterrae]|uniref:hypothetical protein n=1 Tax=Sphingopyxis panaciterrae TaxID=363841 RepID=UPI0014233667|nr:hypothetical protein [Sphingopyxis panaciterrae]NIJ38520.1 hypothetical protein [Sphingopyxis panaciterrae]
MADLLLAITEMLPVPAGSKSSRSIMHGLCQPLDWRARAAPLVRALAGVLILTHFFRADCAK